MNPFDFYRVVKLTDSLYTLAIVKHNKHWECIEIKEFGISGTHKEIEAVYKQICLGMAKPVLNIIDSNLRDVINYKKDGHEFWLQQFCQMWVNVSKTIEASEYLLYGTLEKIGKERKEKLSKEKEEQKVDPFDNYENNPCKLRW